MCVPLKNEFLYTIGNTPWKRLCCCLLRTATNISFPVTTMRCNRFSDLQLITIKHYYCIHECIDILTHLLIIHKIITYTFQYFATFVSNHTVCAYRVHTTGINCMYIYFLKYLFINVNTNLVIFCENETKTKYKHIKHIFVAREDVHWNYSTVSSVIELRSFVRLFDAIHSDLMSSLHAWVTEDAGGWTDAVDLRCSACCCCCCCWRCY